MALDSYTNLKAAVADIIARSDLTSQIVDAITLFEARVNKRLLVHPMETTATITMVAGVGALPADFLQQVRLTWSSGGLSRDLDYVHPSWFSIAYPASQTDTPAVYTIEGGNIETRPLTSDNLSLVYRQNLPALASNSSNWLLADHPDIYLAGVLGVVYAVYIRNAAQGAQWQAVAEEGLDTLTTLDQRTRGQVAMRAEGVTP